MAAPNMNGELDQDGDRVWTDEDGDYHREDGPALIWNNTNPQYCWFIHGYQYAKDDWLQYLKSGQSSLDQASLNKVILENI
mgnify:CR=1 FL=1|jgi:hypothetical protein